MPLYRKLVQVGTQAVKSGKESEREGGTVSDGVNPGTGTSTRTGSDYCCCCTSYGGSLYNTW